VIAFGGSNNIQGCRQGNLNVVTGAVEEIVAPSRADAEENSRNQRSVKIIVGATPSLRFFYDRRIA
jgi:hypothetical protein